MTSDKKTISLLADLFVKKGLRHIVISPGSRNAPIILAFANHPKINAISVVDERSAAFFALGMAQQTGKTVAIACTSGSAVLNYASAIAEAFYQKIPLLVLTADRPPKLIDVGDGQTIRQENVFANIIKKSYQLPLDVNSDEDLKDVNRQLNEAIYFTQFPEAGPVHVNIPFDEPLYDVVSDGPMATALNFEENNKEISGNTEADFLDDWHNSRKVMLIAGQNQYPNQINELLIKISEEKQVVVLTETTSNLSHPGFIDCIDNVLTAIDETESVNFQPDMLVTLGGAVVSKKIKKYLRQYRPKIHWHLSPSGEKRDTYLCLNHNPAIHPIPFLEKILPQLSKASTEYLQLWMNRKKQVEILRRQYLSQVSWSDLKVFDILFKNIPQHSMLHLGNSTPVRYSQLFGSLSHFKYFSNRGVSGIDGQLSTAAGSAYANRDLHTIITGDMGFFYDSNALMNHNLRSNLKIIVINNGGGGIFRFIPGPDSSNQLEKFFEAKHSWKAGLIAKAFDINYFKAEDEKELRDVLSLFYAEASRPALLEIITHAEANAQILRDYFSFLKISSH